MIYEVIISDKAAVDLRNIYEYIAFTLESAENAKNQLNRIEKCIYALEQFPERFRLYYQEPWLSRNTRVVAVDNYLVFYIPNPNKKTVTIIRILYGSRDIDKELNK